MTSLIEINETDYNMIIYQWCMRPSFAYINPLPQFFGDDPNLIDLIMSTCRQLFFNLKNQFIGQFPQRHIKLCVLYVSDFHDFFVTVKCEIVEVFVVFNIKHFKFNISFVF